MFLNEVSNCVIRQCSELLFYEKALKVIDDMINLFIKIEYKEFKITKVIYKGFQLTEWSWIQG